MRIPTKDIARAFLNQKWHTCPQSAIYGTKSCSRKYLINKNCWQEQLGYAYDAAGNLNFQTNNTLLQNFNVNNENELATETNGGALTVAGTTTIPATNVTVNTSNAVLYADSTFASTNQPWVNGNNTFTAIAKDSYGRKDTNSVTVNLQTTNNYTYDLNGNLLGDGTRNFAYDDENQLTSVWVANVWSNSFVYDGKMRRKIEKDYIWNSSTWTQTNEIHFIYDGNAVIQERDANNSPLVTYTRSGSSLLARTDNGQEIVGSPSTAYYHMDGNGNVTCLIYANQLIAAKYLYDPYGNTLSLSGPLAPLNTYRFASKEWNDRAGIYNFGRRYYDPSLQRFVNRDPLAENGGLNLYGYCGNNPVSLVDLLGLCPPKLPWWLQTIPEDDSFWDAFYANMANSLQQLGDVTLNQINGAIDLGIKVPNDTIWMGYYSINGNPQDFVPLSQAYKNAFQQSPDQVQANILMGTLLTEATLVIPGAVNATAARFTAATDTTAGVTTRFISTENGIVDVQPTLNRIESGGSFPHPNDGSIFRNDASLLPAQSPGYYNEYVVPTPGVNGAGAMRIVTGQGGELYFTPNHYQTFVPLNP